VGFEAGSDLLESGDGLSIPWEEEVGPLLAGEGVLLLLGGVGDLEGARQ
jgi:hypothetical protein